MPSYYLRYFYAHDKVLAEQREGVPRAHRGARSKRASRAVPRPGAGREARAPEQRGGAYYSEAAIGLVGVAPPGDGAAHEVDMRNEGTLGGLADDDVVEVPARVDPDGPSRSSRLRSRPSSLGSSSTSPPTSALRSRRALSGDPADVRKALLAHPLIGQWDARRS